MVKCGALELISFMIGRFSSDFCVLPGLGELFLLGCDFSIGVGSSLGYW